MNNFLSCVIFCCENELFPAKTGVSDQPSFKYNKEKRLMEK